VSLSKSVNTPIVPLQIEIIELLRNITCWSLTCVGRLVFNLNSGWVSLLEVLIPSMISMALILNYV